MIFFLGSFIALLKFLEKPGVTSFIVQSLFLLIALFTKETAVIIPVIMAGFVLFYKKTPWKKLILPACSWAVVVLIWIYIRSKATLVTDSLSITSMINAGLDRLGVIVQYIGKIFIPVNLSVFPEYNDISIVWGFLAIGFFAALIFFSRSYTRPLTYLGLFWFLIFLLPVLIVPKTLNDQVFEHRLYLPIIGILLMLSQVYPFTGKITQKNKIVLVGIVAMVFSIQSIYRTAYFNDPITFWTKAVEGSPHSAYAHTLLGTKVEEPERREQLFKRAYELDPTLKNLNYYIGKVLFDKKQIDSAEIYLRNELAHNQIPDAYFLLAQISFEKNQLDSAAICLEKVIELDPLHPQANHNLVLLYYQHGQTEKARLALQGMQSKGMDVGQDLLNMFKKQ
jgi:tetratricopeptide (TPR) repeat protein